MNKYLLFVNVLASITGLTIGDENFKVLEFNLCHSPKHCIKCTQHEIGYGQYYTVPDQENYLKFLLDKFNEFRSWYANEYKIGNMRFAKWNFAFHSLAIDTATMVGNADISCMLQKPQTPIAQRMHRLGDFVTTIKNRIDVNSTNHVIFQNQLNALVNLAVNSTHLVKYNVNEFGCSYSFKPLVSRTVFLLRCIFYVDKDITEGEIISKGQICTNCTETESCIREKYPGLCVPTNSTEKYVRNLFISESHVINASMVVYIKLYLFVTIVLVILCEILLINKI